LEISYEEYELELNFNKKSPARFRNPHTVKIKKIQINRGLGSEYQYFEKILKNLKKLRDKSLLLQDQKKLLLGLKFVRIWN
jgi:hypothetical protein